MTQQEKEKMFLDLNSVLVKFWIEQGRPDKEIKIELLERMLNWQKKAGIVIPDEQSKEPVSEDLEEAAEDGARQFYVTGGYSPFPHIECGAYKSGFISGAEWQKEQMMKEAVEGYVNYYEDSGGILMAEAQVGCPYHNGDKVKIIVIKEDKK